MPDTKTMPTVEKNDAEWRRELNAIHRTRVNKLTRRPAVTLSP